MYSIPTWNHSLIFLKVESLINRSCYKIFNNNISWSSRHLTLLFCFWDGKYKVHWKSKKFVRIWAISKKTYYRDFNNCWYSYQFQLDIRVLKFIYGRLFRRNRTAYFRIEKSLSNCCCIENFFFHPSDLCFLYVPIFFDLLREVPLKRIAESADKSLMQTEILCDLVLHDRIPSNLNPNYPHLHHDIYSVLVLTQTRHQNHGDIRVKAFYHSSWLGHTLQLALPL